MAEKMRTRCLTSMTNSEVEKYLERRDVIIIPVGVAETHGAYPLDCEYVWAEAYARLIAEQVDGLVLPNLVYFHPGATQVGRGTVHMSMSDGFNYVTAIAESLLRQGFRRQVYIPAHQPTSQFLLPMITEFFDKNKVPIMYLDMIATLQAAGAMPPMDFSKPMNTSPVSTDEQIGVHATIIGAYKICNRLHDFPTGAEVNTLESPRKEMGDMPEGMKALFRIFGKRPTLLSCTPAFYYSDPSDHGTSIGLPETREGVEHEAEYGARYLAEQVSKVDFLSMMEDLKLVDQYQNSVIMEKYGKHLPKNKWSENVVKDIR